ncbi:hypothetical protein ACFLT7_01070 [candidate division KSB1 bacterium]
MRPSALTAVLFALLFITTCSTKFTGTARITPENTADSFLALHQLGSACLPAKALLQFTWLGAEGKSRRTMGIIRSSPPGKWRVDLLGNLGGTIMEIRSRGDSVAVYLPRERLQARDRLARLATLSDLGLPPIRSLSVSLWFLGIPEAAWLDGLTRSKGGDADSGRLVFTADDGAEHEIRFDPERKRVNSYRLSWSGREATARYSNFRHVDGLARPFRVEILTARGGSLTLDFRQVMTPVAEDQSAFEPRSAPDIRPVAIEDIQWGIN